VAKYTYGTTNNQLVDISPTGNLCAGTWNRNTGGGIANYTICSKPDPLPSTGGCPTRNGLRHGIGEFRDFESGGGLRSCAGHVGHPCRAAVLSFARPVGAARRAGLLCGQQQPAAVALRAALGNHAASPNLACPLPPGVTLSIDSGLHRAAWHAQYTVGTAAIASINGETNQITAEQPGTTVITASVAGGASSAGYFSTCPPAVDQRDAGERRTVGTITQGVQQNLTTTIIDTQGNPITGLTLDYQSTDPIDISAANTIGGVSPPTSPAWHRCMPSASRPPAIRLPSM
jgi:hypothetical protein